jgi:DNA-binding IclR family transcriptional regulator
LSSRPLGAPEGKRPKIALGIANALADGPQALSAVAARTNTPAPSIARFLRALHALGIVVENDGRCSLTAAGALLRRDVPGSMRDAVREP